MPSTNHSEIALRRRQDKQEFVRQFPGLLTPAELPGKTVEQVTAVAGVHLLLFTDGTFLVTPAPGGNADEMLALLQGARPVLEPFQPTAYAELDRHIAGEREAMRLARMEKVLGAVETNLPRIPELRAELRRMLDGDGERHEADSES